jgi:hypothetical protein
MSRNLIAAKAWENGRERICPQCALFGIKTGEIQGYAWDNCQKRINGTAVADLSKWDGDICSFFRPKQKT